MTPSVVIRKKTIINYVLVHSFPLALHFIGMYHKYSIKMRMQMEDHNRSSCH